MLVLLAARSGGRIDRARKAAASHRGSNVGRMNIESDVSLSAWCTLGVGGPARWFCRVTTEQEIGAALAWARTRTIRVHVLGGGSNVVIADEGFDGLVLQVDIRGVDRSDVNGRASFTVGAGEPWDPFVAATIAEDCAGLECLSGIPGLVGGTPVQNVGAYGQDVSATITHVHAIDRERRESIAFSAAECAFGYRVSRFKREDLNRYIVTRVEFALKPGGAPTLAYADVIAYFQEANVTTPSLAEARDAVIRIRRRKGMVIE